MDCKTMVLDWLREHGADGLCEPETECGCGLDDFAPCGDGPYPHCKAAISRTLLEGEFIGDGGPGDKAYFVMPNVELKGRAAGESPVGRGGTNLSAGLGAVLTYRNDGRAGVGGQQVGADGAGTYAVLFMGDPYEAAGAAREYVSRLRGRIRDVVVVTNEPMYLGPAITVVEAPNAELCGGPSGQSERTPGYASR